jgi:hypothetical protein
MMITRTQKQQKEKIAEEIRKAERKVERAQRELDAARFAFDNLPEVKQEKKEKEEAKAKKQAHKKRVALEDQMNGWADDIEGIDDWAADWIRKEGPKIASGLAVFEQRYSDIAFGMGSMDVVAKCSVECPLGHQEVIEISKNGHDEVECDDLPFEGLSLLYKGADWKEFVETTWKQAVVKTMLPSQAIQAFERARGDGSGLVPEDASSIDSYLIPYFLCHFGEHLSDFNTD